MPRHLAVATTSQLFNTRTPLCNTSARRCLPIQRALSKCTIELFVVRGKATSNSLISGLHLSDMWDHHSLFSYNVIMEEPVAMANPGKAQRVHQSDVSWYTMFLCKDYILFALLIVIPSFS